MGRLTKRLGQMKHILYGEAGDKDVDQHKCEVSERQLQKQQLCGELRLMEKHWLLVRRSWASTW